MFATGLDTKPEPQPQPLAPSPSPEESEALARPLVYTDDYAFDKDAFPNVLIRVRTLHVGDHLVKVDQEVNGVRVWSIAVTDDGAAYVQIDHSVWFTDGGPPSQIAKRSCGSPSADDNGLGFWERRPLDRMVRLLARVAGRPGYLRHQPEAGGRPLLDTPMPGRSPARRDRR